MPATPYSNSLPFLKHCFASLPAAIYVTSVDGQIFYTNLAFQKLFRAANAKVFDNLNARDLYENPKERDKWITKPGANSDVVHQKIRCRRLDGTVFDAEDSANFKPSIGGTILIGMIVDATQKSAYDADREFFTENAPVAYLLADHSGIIVYANKRLVEIAGKPHDQVIGTFVWDLYVFEERELVRAAITDKLHQKRVTGVVSYGNINGEDGQPIPVSVSDALVSFDPARIVAWVVDLRVAASLSATFCRPWLLETHAFDGAAIFTFSKSLDGHFESGNLPFCSEVGLLQSELLGKRDVDLYDKPLADQYVRDDQWVIRHKKVFQRIERHGPKAGVARLVHTIKAPILNDMGEPIGIQGLFWDVEHRTEVSRIEVELSRSRFGSAYYGNLGVFRSTKDGRIVEANDTFSQILGYLNTRDFLGEVSSIGKQIYADPSQREEHIQILQTNGILDNVEFQVKRKDGSIIWVVESSKAVFAPGTNSVRFIVGCIHDISRIKEAELRYLRLRESGSDAIYTHTLDTPIRFTSLNPAGERISGYKESEFISLRPEEFIHPDSLPVVLRQIDLKRERQISSSPPYRIVVKTKSGEFVSLLVSSHLIVASSTGKSEIQGIARIVPPEELNTALLKLNALTQEGEFLRHEMLGVANAISFRAATLTTSYNRGLGVAPDVISGLEAAIKLFQRYREDLHKTISSREILFSVERIGIENLIGECKDACLYTARKTASSSGGAVKLRFINQMADCELMVDPVLIRRAIFNLVSNACESVGATLVTVCVKQIAAPNHVVGLVGNDFTKGEKCIAISVADDGSGIDDKILLKLRGGFMVGNSSKKGQHCGLGLIAVDQYIRLHRGHLSLANQKRGFKATILLKYSSTS